MSAPDPVAEVLAVVERVKREHSLRWDEGAEGIGIHYCACGERDRDRTHYEHVRAHQAAALREAGLIPEAARRQVAEAWFAGYDKGNLDGYFGTHDERTRSPYADLDPYRDEL